MRRWPFGVLFTAIAALGGVGGARADVIYELAPSVGAGVTDNAAITATGEERVGASFSTAGGSARVRYRGSLVEHALGYRLTYTKYLMENGPDSLSHNMAWLTGAELSSRWKLQLGASGTLTRSSGVDPTNPITVVPQAGMAGSLLYLAVVANEGLSYKPDARWAFEEALTAGHLRYLESMVDGMNVELPKTTLVSLALSGNRLLGRETLMLDLSATDMLTEIDSTMPVDPARVGHTLFASVLAGWKHDLSAVWSTTLQAGPTMIARFDGNGVIAPAAIATVAYARLPWTAALSAAQTAMPNPYLGEATLTDQILARAAVPLMRDERLAFGGYGGYLYARVANAESHLDRSYDQFVAGLSLIYRFRDLPLAAAATYSVLSQRGSNLPERGDVPDVARQYVLVTLRGDFAWGPGTPPLFGGAL